MTLTADYVTDLGITKGLYPMNIGNSPLNNSLLNFLPTGISELYSNRNNFRGCRTNDIVPRKLRLTFDNEFVAEIEVPVTMTLEQVQQTRVNAGAVIIETVGERINYAKLRWLVGDTTP